MADRKNLKILDIGGASGNFALSLSEFFSNIKCEIFVVDTTQYETWMQYKNKINFIEGSANKLTTIFREEKFDLIFANRVFHHFINRTWEKTIHGMIEIMKQIFTLLKQDGVFCINDHFYNGLFYDKATSKIIYMLTSCTLQPIVKLCKKLGAESAGVGACFLSKKMWITILTNTGFIIDRIMESEKAFKVNKIKKICLCNKSIVLDNIILVHNK
jgi:ubiquinone/menaquinone biosynthesis C-methylase UbiE